MFKASFLANQAVEDADINAIGANIAEAEYPIFVNGVTYGVDALNGITAQLVTAGVKRGAGDNCAVSLSGTTAFIKSGVAFFDSGVAMTIDDDGISVEREDSTQVNYVFLFYDPTLNVAGARCAVSIPSGIEYVLLATISASGEVSQNVERFCKSKVLDAPNTPLVIYNSIEGSYSEAIEEIIEIPNLNQYTMVRISRPDASLREFWVIDISDVNDVRGAHVDGGSAGVHAGIFWPLNGTNKNSYYFGESGYIDITLDFESSAIGISIGKGYSVNANSVKIELFAGEVQ